MIENMTRRTISIEVDIPGTPAKAPMLDGATDHDDRYADLANAVWMLLQAGSFSFLVKPDTKADADHLNKRWSNYNADESGVWRF